MNNNAYNLELLSIAKSVPDGGKDNFIGRYASQAKNPAMIFGLSAYLGWFGVDRFFLGQALLGILKLITFGGFGIWYFIDLFLTAGIARDQNVELAREISSSIR